MKKAEGLAKLPRVSSSAIFDPPEDWESRQITLRLGLENLVVRVPERHDLAMKIPRTLAARYFGMLRTEGYRPRMDRDDDRHARIPFKSEGQLFLLFVDEDDETYFHLGMMYELPPAWTDVGAALARANEINAQLKAVKVTLDPEGKAAARFNVEAFLGAPASMTVIERSIGALRYAAREFFAEARERRQLDA